MPHTVVLAESRMAGAVLAGIRAGRSWRPMGAGTAEWSTTPAEAGFVRVEARYQGGPMAAPRN
jgi:hypothetical protein